MFHIEEIQARLDDEAALAKVLASAPWPESVRGLLRKPFFARKWDSTTRGDHWLASDGGTVVSLIILGASASAVARMRLRFDDLRIASPALQPCRELLRDVLQAITREDDQAAHVSRDAPYPPLD